MLREISRFWIFIGCQRDVTTRNIYKDCLFDLIFRKIIKDYAMKDDAKKGTNNKNVIDMINLYYTHTLYNYI